MVLEALESLKYIGRTSVETEFELVALETVRFIREVGKAAVKNKLEDETSIAASFIGDIGKAAAEKKFEGTPYQVALSIAKLTISSGEIINKAFQDYELRLIEKDIDSFKKFMYMYRQELEKLRNNKSE